MFLKEFAKIKQSLTMCAVYFKFHHLIKRFCFKLLFTMTSNTVILVLCMYPSNPQHFTRTHGLEPLNSMVTDIATLACRLFMDRQYDFRTHFTIGFLALVYTI